MMSLVQFKFDMEQQVNVIALGIPGVVDALMKDHHGIQYRVVYWYGVERKSEWVYDFEIEGKK